MEFGTKKMPNDFTWNQNCRWNRHHFDNKSKLRLNKYWNSFKHLRNETFWYLKSHIFWQLNAYMRVLVSNHVSLVFKKTNTLKCGSHIHHTHGRSHPATCLHQYETFECVWVNVYIHLMCHLEMNLTNDRTNTIVGRCLCF